jgi:hypothetical protein
MQKPSRRVLVCTGIASAILVSLSWILGDTSFDWLGLPFWIVGFFAAAIIFPQGAEGDHAQAYLVLVCILNLVLTWAGLLLLMEIFGRFFAKEEKKA